MSDIRKRVEAYLEKARKADGKELSANYDDSKTWWEFERASIDEGPWMAERLLEAVTLLEAVHDIPVGMVGVVSDKEIADGLKRLLPAIQQFLRGGGE
jgi:hypothetical protein